MKDALILSALSVLPKNRVARLMGAFARTRLPAVARRALLRWYVGKYGVNLAECEGELDDFPTLTAFFTRALKPGARPVDPAPDAIVSPCDGMTYAVGRVQNGRIPQSPHGAAVGVPGKSFDGTELLGGDARYVDGEYAVLYLSPRDYHRVHVPREGSVVRSAYLPGRLWPVFPSATRGVDELFSRNERLTTWIAADLGGSSPSPAEYALVMVGAFGVGRIRVVYDPQITNTGMPAVTAALPAPVPLDRAAELGRFEMGSTVILVFPRGSVEWTISPGDPVRLGAAIGRLPQN